MAKKSMLQLGEEKLAQEDIGASPMSHDENLRANALALACRYYVETICKDGDLYREMIRENRVLKPATYVGVIEVACSFEMFIRGELKKDADSVVVQAMENEARIKEQKIAHEQHMRELDDLTKDEREGSTVGQK